MRIPSNSSMPKLIISLQTKKMQVNIAEKEWKANQKLLENYYMSVPLVEESSPIFLMLESFAEHIWGGGNSYTTEEVSYSQNESVLPLNKNNIENRDILLNMQMMEERYAFENELMQAVANGQMQKVSLITSNITTSMFEKRLTDPVRNLKNYSIIMNTICRM